MMNFGMQVYNIQQFLVNNGYDPEQYDVAAHIDPTLSLTENKKEFARKLGIPISQMGGRVKATAGRDYNRAARKEVDAGFCDYLLTNCEQNCNNNACRAYKKEKCPGEVEPCRPSRQSKAVRQKTAPIYGDCDVAAYCVMEHERPPQHNSRTGLPIRVKGYCVEPHKRLCRRSGYG